MRVSAREIGGGIKFNRIRRITGYLVGDVDRFNDAKRAEERDRVTHKLASFSKERTTKNE